MLAEIGAAPTPAVYAARLEAMRGRIRAAYGVPDDVRIVFAPSGTDLEYVALACVAGRAPAGTHTVLLGADEVGSGCIHSAHGLYLAHETALGVATTPGAAVPGLGGVHVDLVDIPVRDRMGRVRPSHYITARMLSSLAAARAASRHSLVHIVHGSKTGLILPSLADVDRLIGGATLVVDACQARITSQAVNDYLARDAIVFVTGSKFMGGPPFSGFALIPETLANEAPALPAGFATIFRRAEWPEGWPGAEILAEAANPGLLLRLEASLFELERFQALPVETVERVILAFHAAVRSQIVEVTAARRVAPYPPGHVEDADTHPIEMRTPVHAGSVGAEAGRRELRGCADLAQGDGAFGRARRPAGEMRAPPRRPLGRNAPDRPRHGPGDRCGGLGRRGADGAVRGRHGRDSRGAAGLGQASAGSSGRAPRVMRAAGCRYNSRPVAPRPARCRPG